MGNISQTPFVPAPPFLSIPGIENFVSTSVVTAGSAYFSLLILYATVTVTQMRTMLSGSPTGNVDMGIYDNTGTNGAPNNRLGSTGANAAVTGVFTKSLTANLLLNPGIYWLAVVDTVADTFNARNPTSSMAPAYKTSATNLTVLPATAGAVVDVGNVIATIALPLGGYS